MQAIQTKYLCPTNSRGSRIKATCEGGSVTVGYDHALNIDDNHRAACEALITKLGWTAPYYSPMVGGTFDHCMYWVFTGNFSPMTNTKEATE